MTAVGQPLTLSGWAKQQINTGYAGKCAYSEQYFDSAYMIDVNGNVTTNSAGILSPYGEFFPTQPGPAALETMPDIETGQQGTGVVNVIKLQLDVNHDGIMDLSFGGPDNTSQYRPFVFWINNDHDEPGSGSTPDQDLNAWGTPPQNRPDYAYGAIRCQRNLEDFARLWVCGLPLLPPSQGYTVTLSMSPSSGNPGINLYRAYDTNGGIGYLTNGYAAAAQFTQQFLSNQLMFDYSKRVAPINNGQSYTLPVNSDGSPQFTNFLFEGSGAGSGQLILTVAQGSNVLAQTSAWLDLHDIRDLYEQALVTNVIQDWPEMVEQTPVGGFEVLHSPAANPSDGKQLVLFVHGWRLDPWATFNFAETMFKRLYWQGYLGRFAAVRWPTRSGATDPFLGLEYATYNRSEHIAFKSGTGTAEYLTDLRRRFPDYTISACAHSMGNIVMMEALKELTASNQAPIDNYVLMQAAVPAQCYDTTVTNLPSLVTIEQSVPTPNTYSNYAAGTTLALRVGGKMVNFFNPIDFALGLWEFNQGMYSPEANGPVTMKPNTFLGYYTDGTNSLLRTNFYNQSLLSIPYGGYYGNGPTRSVTDLHEIMPFVSRPRCKAVGRQGAMAGQIQGGEINLQTQFGFTNSPSDHSGQWNRNIQDPAVSQFYPQLRRGLFPVE